MSRLRVVDVEPGVPPGRWAWRAAWCVAACVLATGCQAVPEEGAPADTSLVGTRAPPGTTLESMVTVPVAVGDLVPAGAGAAPWVKVSLDPAGAKTLFLGRVRQGRMPALPMAVPIGTSSVFFEVYDERGVLAQGEKVLR